MNNLTPLPNGHATSPRGFTTAAVHCGLKKDNQLDLTVVASDYDCTATAVFTQNQVVAAPVLVDRATITANNTTIRAILINAGNANACTGQPGLDNAYTTQQQTATALNCRANQVLILSTGVIGVPLPMDKIKTGIQTAVAQLAPHNGPAAAQAIMTTDTHPKTCAFQLTLPNGTITIGGMAKGSGMIHPNMATMLGLITTDAAIAPTLLANLLKTAVQQSFNRISIDGDTSTNDTVLLLANGASNVTIATETAVAHFGHALNTLCQQLAHMIVRDGEGATKFVEIQITGTQSKNDAHQIAQTIATSPLVKTAFAGSDANWGRILAAAGRAGVTFDQNCVDLWIGQQTATELQLVATGVPTPYQEADAAAIFAQPAFKIRLDLNKGTAADIMWTSDLTHEYVSINGDYRT